VSDRLRDRLLERIRAHGPLTWAQYMEAALYDPDDGFFARHPVGETRHFVTAPHVSDVFARLLAEAARDAWETLGRPDDFAILELGAGDGTLARGILAAAADLPVRYVCVERSAGARETVAGRGLHAVATIPEAGSITGLVLANELFDNVPFHLLRGRDGGAVEVLVGADDEGLVAMEAPPTIDAPALPDGEERPVSTEARAILHEIAGILERGYALVFDYGFTDGEPPEPVRGYAAQRMAADLLADPGSSDLTGPVDFGDLARTAGSLGLQVWGPVTQRAALHALGYRRALEGLRAEQLKLEEAGDWREAIRLFGARGEASMLVGPSDLGNLKVLAFGTAGLPEPRATRGE
jgi:SAM-dependent MidA family methyltransferase